MGTPKRFEVTDNASLSFLSTLSQYGREGVGGWPGGIYLQCMDIPAAVSTICTDGHIVPNGGGVIQ